MEYRCTFTCKCEAHKFEWCGILGKDNVFGKLARHGSQFHGKPFYVRCTAFQVSRGRRAGRSVHFFSDECLLNHQSSREQTKKQNRTPHECCFSVVSFVGTDADGKAIFNEETNAHFCLRDNVSTSPDGVALEVSQTLSTQYDVWHLKYGMPLVAIIKSSRLIQSLLTKLRSDVVWNVTIRDSKHYRELEARRLGDAEWIPVAEITTECGKWKQLSVFDLASRLKLLAESDIVFNAEVRKYREWVRKGLQIGGEFSNTGGIRSNMGGTLFKEYPLYQDDEVLYFILYSDGVQTTKDLETTGFTKNLVAYYLVWDREDPGRCKWAIWNIYPVALVSKKLHTPALREVIVSHFVNMFRGARYKLLDGTYIKPRILPVMGDRPSHNEVLEVKNHSAIRCCWKCDHAFPSQCKSEMSRRREHLALKAEFFDDKRITDEQFRQNADKVDACWRQLRAREERDPDDVKRLKEVQSETGINRRSRLLDLEGFKPITGLVVDWMHTMDEGAASAHVHAATKWICDEMKYCRFSDIRKFSLSFDAGNKEGKTRLDYLWRNEKSKNKKINLKAAQVREYVKVLGAFFKDLIKRRAERGLNVSSNLVQRADALQVLNSLYKLVFETDCWTDHNLALLRILTDEHRSLFYKYYQEAYPKSHDSVHFVDTIKAVGSLKKYMCYGLESYHQQLNRAHARSNKKSVDRHGILEEMVHFQFLQWKMYSDEVLQGIRVDL
jgi:hypothetical protein